MKRNVLLVVMSAAVTFMLLGCNTMEGFGKDTEHAGEKIQDSADAHK